MCGVQSEQFVLYALMLLLRAAGIYSTLITFKLLMTDNWLLLSFTVAVAGTKLETQATKKEDSFYTAH